MTTEHKPHSGFPDDLEQAINVLRGGPSDHDKELDAAEKVVRDELTRWSEAYGNLEEQLETYERALRDIVHLPDETQAYSYADACVNIARAALNPASEPN